MRKEKKNLRFFFDLANSRLFHSPSSLLCIMDSHVNGGLGCTDLVPACCWNGGGMLGGGDCVCGGAACPAAVGLHAFTTSLSSLHHSRAFLKAARRQIVPPRRCALSWQPAALHRSGQAWRLLVSDAWRSEPTWSQPPPPPPPQSPHRSTNAAQRRTARPRGVPVDAPAVGLALGVRH